MQYTKDDILSLVEGYKKGIVNWGTLESAVDTLFNSQHDDKPIVSGSLSLAQKLLNGIIAADPNVIDEPKIADRVIKALYSDCRKLVKKLGGNDR